MINNRLFLHAKKCIFALFLPFFFSLGFLQGAEEKKEEARPFTNGDCSRAIARLVSEKEKKNYQNGVCQGLSLTHLFATMYDWGLKRAHPYPNSQLSTGHHMADILKGLTMLDHGSDLSEPKIAAFLSTVKHFYDDQKSSDGLLNNELMGVTRTPWYFAGGDSANRWYTEKEYEKELTPLIEQKSILNFGMTTSYEIDETTGMLRNTGNHSVYAAPDLSDPDGYIFYDSNAGINQYAKIKKENIIRHTWFALAPRLLGGRFSQRQNEWLKERQLISFMAFQRLELDKERKALVAQYFSQKDSKKKKALCLSMLQSKDPITKQCATLLLGHMNNKDAFQGLVKALNDPITRGMAAYALCQLGAKIEKIAARNQALNGVEKCLKEGSANARAHAAQIVRYLQPTATTLEALTPLLASKNEWVRCEAAIAINQALKSIGDEKSAASIAAKIMAALPKMFACLEGGGHLENNKKFAPVFALLALCGIKRIKNKKIQLKHLDAFKKALVNPACRSILANLIRVFQAFPKSIDKEIAAFFAKKMTPNAENNEEIMEEILNIYAKVPHLMTQNIIDRLSEKLSAGNPDKKNALILDLLEKNPQFIDGRGLYDLCFLLEGNNLTHIRKTLNFLLEKKEHVNGDMLKKITRLLMKKKSDMVCLAVDSLIKLYEKAPEVIDQGMAKALLAHAKAENIDLIDSLQDGLKKMPPEASQASVKHLLNFLKKTKDIEGAGMFFSQLIRLKKHLKAADIEAIVHLCKAHQNKAIVQSAAQTIDGLAGAGYSNREVAKGVLEFLEENQDPNAAAFAFSALAKMEEDLKKKDIKAIVKLEKHKVDAIANLAKKCLNLLRKMGNPALLKALKQELKEKKEAAIGQAIERIKKAPKGVKEKTGKALGLLAHHKKPSIAKASQEILNKLNTPQNTIIHSKE